jgi:hypothetical protein
MQKTCELGMPVRPAVQLPDERVAGETETPDKFMLS